MVVVVAVGLQSLGILGSHLESYLGLGLIICSSNMINDALVIAINCSSGIVVVDDWVLGDVSV